MWPLAAGDDQFFTLAKGTNVQDSGRIDLQSVVAYMAANSPVSPDYAQRAVGVTVTPPANGTGETVSVKVSSMLFSKAGPSSGDASLAIGGQPVATAALSIAITNAYDEQGQSTSEFTVPKGLYGPQTATVTGPGGTSIALTLVDGKVRIALPRLSWGLHALTASYGGDGTHKASTTKDSSLVLVLL